MPSMENLLILIVLNMYFGAIPLICPEYSFYSVVIVLFFWYHFSGKKCPPFKIVILDEADSMTGAAQVSYNFLNHSLRVHYQTYFQTALYLGVLHHVYILIMKAPACCLTKTQFYTVSM